MSDTDLRPPPGTAPRPIREPAPFGGSRWWEPLASKWGFIGLFVFIGLVWGVAENAINAVWKPAADANSSGPTSLGQLDSTNQLDAHQVTAVALASHPDVKSLCIFDEQGLGKTVEALFAFDRLRDMGAIGSALVFAPKNMVLEWINDLERFFGSKYRAQAVVGTEAEKRRVLDCSADLFVTNFETAVSLEVRLRQLLQKERGQALLIVDESFFVKNAHAPCIQHALERFWALTMRYVRPARPVERFDIGASG